jgi:hypothetical protein
MNNAIEQLWAQLSNQGLVEGECPQAQVVDSPWYVKVLLGFTGWLASLFFLAFLGGAFVFVFESEGAALVLGVLFIGGSYAGLRAPKNEFLEHAALCLSFSGQFLLLWALGEIFTGSVALSFLFLVVQMMLAFLMPNDIHRVLSSLFAVFGFFAVLIVLGLPYLLSGIMSVVIIWIWLHEFDHLRHMRRLRSIGYGLVLGFLLLQIFHQARAISWIYDLVAAGTNPNPNYLWFAQILPVLSLIYLAWHLVKRYAYPWNHPLSVAVISLCLLLAMLSFNSSAIVYGLVVLLLGFANSNRVLMGLGILSSLTLASWYYYQLSETLLVKSGYLMVLGISLLILRFLLNGYVVRHQEGEV